ncbi:AAA family ATPase [Fictibacillus sp. 23RED33]|uniref:3'-5' exonuclease n=1 Tax=Fictibacillus sp. 23RED33 TaxID=2745879 RepID=UPI0018CE8D97|nr:nuclease-related domain-containing DEAD/DEAH box helicase [Fictibacillus sp. 23RED33]MBH0174253.1 AAA family ATPase [Fictibacillus sp. 23RED33]
MAYMVPLTIRSSATAGERLLFHTLKNYLPDDYIVYYEPEIQGRRPDFVILGPDLGLIVLEVKDYTRNTLYQLNSDDWVISAANGSQATVKNPLKQAREYAFHISNVLKKDKSLIQTEGKYQFQLKFPFGYGVVFTRLYQKDMVRDNLYSILEPNLTLARDEIDPENEHFSEELLMEKILDMFIVPYRLKEPLTNEEIAAIRYHLFPEVRISAEFKQAVPYQDQLLLSLKDIKVMDLHQENLAKQLGDKNRLIRGVAGSGKTLILASRAKMIVKEHPDWKVLILCYNISLAQSIRQMVHAKLSEPEDLFDFVQKPEEKKVSDNIMIRNFHQWLKQDLKINEYQIPTILEKIDRNEAILPKYDAVLIDEGQDFEPAWLGLVSRLLNPDTQSLLIVEDRAQNIYKRKTSYVQDTGMSFQGRSKILNINYRNSAQIVKFAWDFYREHSVLNTKVIQGQTEGIEIIHPQGTKRKGPEPFVLEATNFTEEMEKVARTIKKLHEIRKVPYSEMLILYRVKKTNKLAVTDTIIRTFKKHNIPYYWLTEHEGSKRNFVKEEESVKISTIESSKGLDFQSVFVVNTDSMPFPLEESKEKEVSLLYIAMTRAQNYLCVSYSGESEFTSYFSNLKLFSFEKALEVKIRKHY